MLSPQLLNRLSLNMKRRRTPALLSLLAVILLVIIWSLLFVQVRNDRKQVLLSSSANLVNITRSFREHSMGVLRNADEALRVIKFHYERKGASDFPLLNAYFDQGVIDTNFFNQAGIINEAGIYAFSNLPNHKPVNLADREHFLVHKEQYYAYEIFVSKVVFGRATKRWSIQLTRRIDKANGGFGGVSVVSLDPTYLVNFHSRIDLGSQGFTSLVGLDGVARTLRVGSNAVIAEIKEPLPLPPDVQSQSSGTFFASNIHDGVERLYAFERLTNQPLLVLVGVGMRDVLAEHESRRTVYLGFAGLLSVLVLVFCGTAIISLQRSARINVQLLKKTREAALASHHKTEFLASISHELRTPLNGIIGYAEYIMEKAEPPLQLPAKVIYESGGHLLTLINSLLDLNSIEANEMRLAPEPLDLRTETESLVLLHRPALDAKQLNIDVVFSSPGPLPVQMDRLRYRQILGNLIDNATKYSFNHGRIRLEVALVAEGRAVRVCVTDEGIGIPKDHHGSVFDKFWRSEDFATRSYPGSGLGLALSKSLIELMGGSIGFRSQPDEGSTFFFTLPVTAFLDHDNLPASKAAPVGR